jgi:hypothetical protein
LLAEAAPEEFLNAIGAGLAGDQPLLAGMFAERTDDALFAPTSPHIHLVWALEVCAWSPDHFGQAVEHLARLVELDPARASNNGNRPFRSLDSIFCPWHPNASVAAERRLSALDGMRDRHAGVAWDLMLALLPEGHDMSFPTLAPKYRDWKPQKIAVLVPEYLEFIDALVDRLLDDVGDAGDRWVQLVAELSDLPPASRQKVTAAVSALADVDQTGDARDAIWETLVALVRRHREFAHAKWALPADEVDELEQLATRFEPDEIEKRRAWLFNDHMPEIPDVQRGGGDWDAYNAALARLRAEAAAEIASGVTWADVLTFAREAKLPHFFGMALADAERPEYTRELVALLDSDTAADLNFAYGYVERRFRAESWNWLLDILSDDSLSEKQTARMLLSTLEYPRAWEEADARGDEVARHFWREFRTWGLGADFPHVGEVARRLLEANRPAITLDFVHLYMRAASGNDAADDARYLELVADALEGVVSREEPDPELGELSRHDFVDLFAYLTSAGLPHDRLARLEWAYLPALGYDARPVALGRAMADDPNFFSEVVALVYRPSTDSGEDEDEAVEAAVETASDNDTPTDALDDEQRQARATNAYRLLTEWRTVPGLDEHGVLDEERLNEWVDRALERLAEIGRAEVGDVRIGHMLAWSPPDPDGAWPAIAVRNLLQRLQRERIERAIGTELYNSRGVSTRSPFAGGGQERALAASYREQAASYVDRWPRAAAVLRALADSLERDARRLDDDAERTHRGLR